MSFTTIQAPRHIRWGMLLILVGCLLGGGGDAYGQIIGNIIGGEPGVIIDANGYVQSREVDQRGELVAMRKRAREAVDAAKNEKLAFISLPRTFAAVQALLGAGQPIPDQLKYLGGITQLRYVLVYPDEKDLVIAGPAEPWTVQGTSALGSRSGRPALQLDDLVVSLRTANQHPGKVFGCGIYPDPKSPEIAHKIAVEMATRSRAARKAAMEKALGPQEIKIFGTAADTRVALICVAADYKLKRTALGMASVPTVPIGNAIDHSRSAANKYWFKASYDPLLVSQDGNAYQIRGQRLAVEAGQFDFDPRGATERAKQWVAMFTKKMPEMATASPLFAELQNVADLAMLANLVRQDGLDQKVGWNADWLMDQKGYPVAVMPTPRTAQTLVNFTNGSMAAGGVVLQVGPYLARNARQADDRHELTPLQAQAHQLRATEKADTPVLQAP